VVQESPGTLEYEVALYREASPRSEDGGNGLTVDLVNEIPVDQAVPIGTKLQLRATINNESGKKLVHVVLCVVLGRYFGIILRYFVMKMY
jgi:hypothetical protein